MELHRQERPSSIPHGPTIVLLHGLGADESDLMGLASEFDDAWAVVCPRAPRTLPWGGYSWFDLDIGAEGRWIDEAQAAISRDAAIRMLEALRVDREPRHLVVGGFSQGAAISLGVALKRPDLVDGALIMSGACLPTFLADASDQGVGDLPFFVQHGRQDTLLPVADGRAIQKALGALHASVEYHEYEMGHEISFESLIDVRQWLGQWTPGEAGGA